MSPRALAHYLGTVLNFGDDTPVRQALNFAGINDSTDYLALRYSDLKSLEYQDGENRMQKLNIGNVNKLSGGITYIKWLRANAGAGGGRRRIRGGGRR